MSSGEVRKVSRQDIQLVQNLVERCIQLYMSKKEAVHTLLHQAKIEPGFTELVWRKLEEENPDFFRAYYLRLAVKEQILKFNELLEKQVEQIHQIRPTGVASSPISNESLVPPLHQNSAHHPHEHIGHAKPENMKPPANANMHYLYPEGVSSLQPCLHSALNMPAAHANAVNMPAAHASPVNMPAAHASAVNMPAAPARGIDMSCNILLSQTSNMGAIQGLNGGIVKTEVRCAGNPTLMFGSDDSILDTQPSVVVAPVSSFSHGESKSRPLNETILNPDDASSLEVFGQISRSFSLSDFSAADFPNVSDLLESYPRSPFLGTDADIFLDLHGIGEQQELKGIGSSLNNLMKETQ